jgi:hypothetical protein
MGLFSTPKCPIHGIEYKIDKDYMCQQYYFCPLCRAEIRRQKQIEAELAELKQQISDLKQQ